MIVIIIISLIIYLIGFSTIYYRMPEIKKDKKIIIIGVSSIVILIVTIVLVNISAGKIEGFSKENLSISKTTSVFLFAPINTIILLAPIAKDLNKLKEKKISKEKFYKKIAIILGVFLICLVIEKDYIENFIRGLLLSR